MLNFLLNIFALGVNSISERPKPKEISDDSDLIPKIKKGDVSAFQMLVDRHKRRAYYTALGMIGDSDAALDLTQDAWVAAFRSIDSFRDGEPFYPWYHRILVNHCKNFLRHRKVVDRVIAGSIDEERFSDLEGTVFAPESLLEERETKELIWSAIESLPPEQREVIVLTHFEEHSYEEIAELTGVPKGTVMSRLFYARKKIAEHIGRKHET
ncbi:MAG TPA: sigma-70 family RNA polymerase sigma factor [candidate division Zixibacteria bacterium]|nr:sigma-70 family RNA polymerase sigma factor [candidate division Zixibacteria bacterium]